MTTLAMKSWDGVDAEPTPMPERNASVALADELAREFDAPVGLLDLSERIWMARVGVRAEDFPDPEAAACTVMGQGTPERVFVWHPAWGPVWMGLPLSSPDGIESAVAMVGFSADAASGHAGPWGPPCPEPALRAWGQSVTERLRSEMSSCLPVARFPVPQAPLTDLFVRRLRVSDPPERFQKLVTRSLRESLRADEVAWVPSSPREPVVVESPEGAVHAEEFRSLVPESVDEPLRLLDQVTTGGRQWLAVVAADKESGGGWLVVRRLGTARPFENAEIELLRSSASIISTQRANARLYSDLKELLFGIIRALTSAIDAKDPYTSGHSERVARIAVRLGEQLGLNANQRGDLYLMGLLHDVGKIGIEDEVLKKPSRLTPEEYRQIQSHVKIGVHILSDLKKLHHLLPGVAHHHESMDGTGYPSGLAGDKIPLAARILAVADAYDAMSSSRPYRRRLSAERIDEIFREGAATQWDPTVVDALFACRGDIESIRSKGLGESLRRVVGDTLGRHEER